MAPNYPTSTIPARRPSAVSPPVPRQLHMARTAVRIGGDLEVGRLGSGAIAPHRPEPLGDYPDMAEASCRRSANCDRLQIGARLLWTLTDRLLSAAVRGAPARSCAESVPGDAPHVDARCLRALRRRTGPA